MIYKQIMTLLENQGVKVIEAEGKEFDPNFHQAVMTVSDVKRLNLVWLLKSYKKVIC